MAAQAGYSVVSQGSGLPDNPGSTVKRRLPGPPPVNDQLLAAAVATAGWRGVCCPATGFTVRTPHL